MRRTLSGKLAVSLAADEPEPLDYLVLTAANAAQARGYRAQLAARERDGRLTGIRKWFVVADPRGKRAGSGGSTLVVVHELAKRLARASGRGRERARDLFRGQRVLVVHSGGDSRRLPAFAAEGKVFAPLACEASPGVPATLFDVVLDDLRSVSMGEAGGVVIAAGDLLLGVKRLGLVLDESGVTGLAFPAAAGVGSRHGVYVLGRDGRVADFLQKPSAVEARAAGAVRRDGRVLVDSGLMAFAPDAVPRLLRAGGAAGNGTVVKVGSLLDRVRAGRAPVIDLYEQVAMAMAEQRGEAAYLDAVAAQAPPEDRRLLRRLYRGLRGVPFRAHVADRLDFFHIGTTREYLRRMTERADAGACRWDAAAVRAIACKATRGGRGPAVLDHAAADFRTAGSNLVSMWPGEVGGQVVVPRGWGSAWLPIGKRKWSCILFHVDDDGKTPMERGGTFGGAPLAEWLRARGLDADEVWDRDANERTIWTARLWCAGWWPRVWEKTRWVWPKDGRSERSWVRAERFSLAELVRLVNHERLIGVREEAQRRERLREVTGRRGANCMYPAALVAADAQSQEERIAVRLAVEKRLPIANGGPRSLDEMLQVARDLRLCWCLHPGSKSAVRVDHAGLKSTAFAMVSSAVNISHSGVRAHSVAPPRPFGPTSVVEVTAPVRIDLAGGWSDTPPICHGMGGAVVNMAITLGGVRPVRASARLIKDRVVWLRSIDLSREIELTSAEEASQHAGPNDWSALGRAALQLSGVLRLGETMDQSLLRLGGGVELLMEAEVPKGSGLGTSSILGAAALAAVSRLCGRVHAAPGLIHRTSMLEQMVSTGGGWQDQAAGVLGGVHMLRTKAGADQSPRAEALRLGPRVRAMLRERTLLYFTGYRRLAADILHEIVGRYLERDPGTLRTIVAIKENAERVRGAILDDDDAALASGLNRAWELKRRMDPGASNRRIEAIIDSASAGSKGTLEAALMPGAGGGGFLLLVARDARAAARIRRRLLARPPNAHARFAEFAIEPKGLTVSVSKKPSARR